MANQDLVNWANQAKMKGYTDEQLTASLEKQGYSAIDIRDVLTLAANDNPLPQSTNPDVSQQTLPKKKPKKIFLYVLLGIFGLVILTGLYFLLGSSNSENNENIMKIKSMDKSEGTIYSELTLQIPQGTFETDINIEIVSLAATEFDKYVGGAYIISPDTATLQKPVLISITYTDEAVKTYNGDVSLEDLTLAYFNYDSFDYVLIESEFDSSSRTVTGKLSRFYPGEIMIIDKSKTIQLDEEKAPIAQEEEINLEEKNKKTVEECMEFPEPEPSSTGKVSPNERIYCLRDVALENNDETICLEISQDDYVVLVRQNCLRDIAKVKKDPNICAQVGDNESSIRAECYIALAKELNDPSLCEFASPLFHEETISQCVEDASG